jgi:hypothetical protein
VIVWRVMIMPGQGVAVRRLAVEGGVNVGMNVRRDQGVQTHAGLHYHQPSGDEGTEDRLRRRQV